MPDAAARVGDIASKAGDEVHVQMHHRLARGRPDIDADVVAVWPEFGVELGLHHLEQIKHIDLLFARRLEPGGDQPPRHDERVARRDGKAITNREGQRVRSDVRFLRELEEGRGQAKSLIADFVSLVVSKCPTYFVPAYSSGEQVGGIPAPAR